MNPAEPDSGHAKDARHRSAPQRSGQGRGSTEEHYSTRPAKPDRASTSSTSCGTERATHGECTNTARCIRLFSASHLAYAPAAVRTGFCAVLRREAVRGSGGERAHPQGSAREEPVIPADPGLYMYGVHHEHCTVRSEVEAAAVTRLAGEFVGALWTPGEITPARELTRRRYCGGCRL